MELAPGTLLQAGKYKIIEKLGQGGFGIAYRAHHQNLKRDVCIKEFFYSDLCDRAQNNIDVTIITKAAEKLSLVNSLKKKFTKEAQRLAKFQHPNIVQVTDTFEENNTAYFVMEYLQGGSLEDLLSREGALSEHKTKELILPIIDALDAIHKTDLLHLDIKPANIMLRNNQTPVLIDFGISKYMELAGGVTTSAPVGISKGYAPLEQYGGSISDFSKATDIYSLSATIYKMVTGQTPPEPSQMLSNGFKSPRDLRPEISIQLNEAIVKGLATKKVDRHQTMAILGNALGAKIDKSPSTPLTTVKVGEPILATAYDYFKRAEKKRENKQYKGAIDDYTEAIKMKSNESDYFFYRAWCEYELQNDNNAIKDYTTAIKLNPKNSSAALNNRGLCYSRIYRYEDSINDFYKAYERKRDNLYFKNWINAVEGSSSTKTLDDYLSHDWPDKDKVFFERGKIHLQNKERKKAIEDLNHAKKFGNREAAELMKQINWFSARNILPSIVLFFSNSLILVALYLLNKKKFYFEEDDYFYIILSSFLIILYVTSFSLSLTKPGRFQNTVLTFSVPRFTAKWFQRLEKINYSVFPLISFVLYYYIYKLAEYHFGHNQHDLIWILVLLSIISFFSLGYIWKRR